MLRHLIKNPQDETPVKWSNYGQKRIELSFEKAKKQSYISLKENKVARMPVESMRKTKAAVFTSHLQELQLDTKVK